MIPARWNCTFFAGQTTVPTRPMRLGQEVHFQVGVGELPESGVEGALVGGELKRMYDIRSNSRISRIDPLYLETEERDLTPRCEYAYLAVERGLGASRSWPRPRKEF